jgi:DNA-binding NtrC family response regulator
MADILVVDDDPSIARAFERFLKYDRHEFRIASSAEAGLRMLGERLPDLVFMDVRMPGLDGLQALPMMRAKYPSADVVIMTAHGNSQTSIDAMRAGAFDLLPKPLDVEVLRAIIQKVKAAQAVRAKMATAGDTPADETPALVGETPAMLEVFKLIGRLATLDVPSLVVGERGTGKRSIVEAIHENSARRNQPLTLIDCHGPDASVDIQRLCDRALTGTVHLVHLEALVTRDQLRVAALLRDKAGPSPMRLIGSTELDLSSLADQGEFNRELYEDLAVITLRLPPLRERRDDIQPLVDVLLRRLSRETGRTIQGIDAKVAKLFREHSWPANISELASVIRRAGILSSSGVISVDDLGDSLSARRHSARRIGDSSLAKATRDALRERLAVGGDPDSSPYHDVVAIVEETMVAEALDITGGNQVKAAEMLGVNRTTLRKRAQQSD